MHTTICRHIGLCAMSSLQSDGGYRLPDIIDNGSRICVRIDAPNDAVHLANMAGALRELGKWWNWERDALKRGTEAAQLWNNVLYDMEIGGCDNMRLRQSPTNNCWLEYSLDDGFTWELAFDYSLCKPEVTVTNLADMATAEELAAAIMALLNTAPSSVSPTLVYDGNATQNERRNAAQCYAIRQLVYITCQTAVRQRANARNRRVLFETIASLIATAFAWFTGGVSLAIAALMATAIAIVGYVRLNETPDSAFENEDAKDQLICVVVSRLRNVTPTRSVFNAAWLPSSSLTGDAELLRLFFVELTLRAEFYMAYLKAMEAGMSAAASGLVADDCCELAWGHEYTGVSFVQYGLIVRGTLNASSGFIDPEEISEDVWIANWTLNVPAATTLTRAFVEYTITNKSSGVGMDFAVAEPFTTIWRTSALAPGNYQSLQDFNQVVTSRFNVNLDGNNSNARIRKVKLRGRGIDPTPGAPTWDGSMS